MPHNDGEEECRTCENNCAWADAEVFEVFAVFAEHHYDEKELKQDHERHDGSRYKRGHQVPFDGDAVVQLGMFLILSVSRVAKIGIVTMCAIAEKCLLDIPINSLHPHARAIRNLMTRKAIPSAGIPSGEIGSLTGIRY
jgi:hypothetical protein